MAARKRDYAKEYAQRQAKARREGYKSYGAKRAAKEKTTGKQRDYAAEYRRRQERKAFNNIKSQYGGRPKFNADRTKARISEMEPEEIRDIIKADPGEMDPKDPKFHYH